MYAVTLGTRLHSLIANLSFEKLFSREKSTLWINNQDNMTTPSRRATESHVGGGEPLAGDGGKLRRLDRAITHPGSVKINVEGAFIVDEEAASKNDVGEGILYEHKDIRLPHHTAVVSHVAVDVSQTPQRLPTAN